MMKNILFLCTGNSCRSIMAEGLMKHYGKDKFNSFSAGSNPTGQVHPMSLKTLEKNGIEIDGLYSKSWDDISCTNIDIIITVCDDAAGESCPIFLNKAIKVHLGVFDPAKFSGNSEEIEQEFQKIYEIIERRVKAILEIDIENISNTQLQNKLQNLVKYI